MTQSDAYTSDGIIDGNQYEKPSSANRDYESTYDTLQAEENTYDEIQAHSVGPQTKRGSATYVNC